MGVLDKIFNRKNIRDASALTAAAGLMATGGEMQTTDKPPIPDNTNTPPTREFQTSESQPESKEINSITEDKTAIEPATGKKFIIPEGYKPEISKDGKVSFILKTIQDYRNGGAAVLRTKEERHQHNLQSTPVKPKEIPSQNNTEPQPTSDTTQFNETTPLTADVSNGESLDVGGRIHWEHLGFGTQKTPPRSEKNTQQPEHDNQKEKSKPSNTKEERPSIPNGVTMRYTENTTPETLNLTKYFNKQNKPGANSYNNGDKKFSMPNSTPPQENENEDLNQEKNKNNKDQTTPEEQPSHKPPKEQSPEPIKPPERLKVDGPTAIAFEDNNAPEKEIEEHPADSLAQITGIIENIKPEQLGTSGVRKLLKLGTTLTTLALAALNADNALASNTNQVNLDKSTEHILTNTKEAHNQTVLRSAYFQWLKEYEEHMFDKEPLTKEKFVEDYNNSHPNANISIAELDEFAHKSSLNKKNNFNGKIQSKFSTKGSTRITLEGLSDLPKAKAPNTEIKFGIGSDNSSLYSTPKTPQNLNFNPGKNGGNWNIHQNKPGHSIDSEGNISNTLDIDPTADFGAGGFQDFK